VSRTKLALDVVNDLRNLAGSIESLVASLQGNQPEDVAPIEKKELKEPPKKKQPNLEEVRAKLAALSQDGKQAQVKALITEFGAKKLSDIPAEKYEELLKKAEEL
jgi:hypothetical protein